MSKISKEELESLLESEKKISAIKHDLGTLSEQKHSLLHALGQVREESNKVKKELEVYHKKANKYLMLHDTVSFRYGGFSGDENGVWNAVMEFVHSHPEWEIWESLPSWPGMTVLKRK